MANKWFWADPHIDHEGIVKVCKRPYQTIRHHNRELIRNYQAVVKDEDEVWIVGDLCLKGPEYMPFYHRLLNQLPGQKHLIFGNHDTLTWQQYIEAGFVSCHSSCRIEHNGINYIINHDPAPSCIDRETIWLCGHVHDLFKISKNVMNVGVDVNDYYPVQISTIERLMSTQKFSDLVKQMVDYDV